MLTERIIGAFTFRSGVYAEVEEDTNFTRTAWILVAVVAFLNQIGSFASSELVNWVVGAVVGTIFALVAFAVGALIINWVGREKRLDAPYSRIPLWPLRADYVVVMTNPQYRRQIRRHGKKKKLSWADWYRKQNIPIHIYDVTTKHGAQIPSIKHIDEFK